MWVNFDRGSRIFSTYDYYDKNIKWTEEKRTRRERTREKKRREREGAEREGEKA